MEGLVSCKETNHCAGVGKGKISRLHYRNCLNTMADL